MWSHCPSQAIRVKTLWESSIEEKGRALTLRVLTDKLGTERVTWHSGCTLQSALREKKGNNWRKISTWFCSTPSQAHISSILKIREESFLCRLIIPSQERIPAHPTSTIHTLAIGQNGRGKGQSNYRKQIFFILTLQKARQSSVFILAKWGICSALKYSELPN